jgi:hypothetical protein
VTQIFIEFWEHESAGAPFAVGDVVDWPVAEVNGDGLVAMLGAELGRQLRWAASWHTPDPHRLTGAVTSIQAVFAEEQPLIDDPHGYTHDTVPGSGRLEARLFAARHEHTEEGRWAGFIVDVEAEVRRQQVPG